MIALFGWDIPVWSVSSFMNILFDFQSRQSETLQLLAPLEVLEERA